ncbi:neurofilament heavy polypeptide-like isoform X2 [Thrips palmi]|uniref:Neurofilament heavy polypeptide-like isoform X2 n=1 Tax=Thrips palmi TaxID=161013 RepID=A0A6P8ZD70_THRPL|nr:neurofilament heavy polypeptide-like isoform X2 [Thrips palmi]
MPPLRRSPVKVPTTSCRVCLSNNTVMLEVFGTESQPVSYDEDIKKCLSIEVKKGDGLPSKICIKCAGLLGEYRPFVDNTLEAESERSSKCDSTSGSNTSCHYCLTSGNILFPVPETSIVKTKECFAFEVTAKNQICVRCQFHLEGLHELKQKACAALKQFNLNSVAVQKLSPARVKEPSVDDKNLSPARVKAPSPARAKAPSVEDKKLTPARAKRSSVDDIVVDLKDKCDTEKLKTDKKMDLKEVSVCLLDIVKILGEELLKGTISATKVFERLHPPLRVNGHAPVKASSSKTPKQQTTKKVNESVIREKSHLPSKSDKQPTPKRTPKPLPVKKSRRLSRLSDPAESDLSDEPALEGKKRIRETSEPETDILPRKSRRRSESERSESEKSLADVAHEKPEKDPPTFVSADSSGKKSDSSEKKSDSSEKKSDSSEKKSDLSEKKSDLPEKNADLPEKKAGTEKEEDQLMKESSSFTDESVSERKKGSKKPRSKKEKMECDSSSDSVQKPLQPSIVRPAADGSITENGLDSESPKTNRRRTKKVEFAMDLDADEDDEDVKMGSRRKRRHSDGDDSYSPKVKGKGRKKLREPSNSDDENDADESSISKQIALDQPEYLRELDDLLKFTPKATFKPFICSVCHEGYISTVKGKLHKLVVHDPHANLVLKLTRCDGDKSLMEASNGVIEDPEKKSKVKIKVEIKSEAPDEDYERSKLAVHSDTREAESKPRRNSDEIADDADDLFSDKGNCSAPPTGKSSDALFNSLFNEPNIEKVSVAAESKGESSEKSDKNGKLDESSKTGNDNDSDECDPLSVAVPCEENKSEMESNKPVGDEISESESPTDEGISKPASEKPSEEETSSPEQEVSIDKETTNPECEVPTDADSSKPESEKSLDDKSSKAEFEKRSEEESSKSGCDEPTGDGECVQLTEGEKSEVEVMSSEKQKASDVEASDLEPEGEVTPEKNCDSVDSQSSDEVQNGEETRKDSKSNKGEIPNSEYSASNLHEATEQKTGKIVPIENEEAVSSTIVEDQSPSQPSTAESLDGHGDKGSEADVENSPVPVDDDDVSGSSHAEHSKGTVDDVDSTTATATSEVVDEDKGENVESSSVVSDTSAVDAEGIIVGDD